jgi:hypothetical protein
MTASDYIWVFQGVTVLKSKVRGRVRKQVTLGSKTALMDVFLCVPLGSSTVQLRDSLGNRRACSCSEDGFGSENGYRVWGVYYRRAAFCFAFFCKQKDSMQRIFITKCFMFTVGSVCYVKLFTTGWLMFHCWQRRRNCGEEVAKTSIKRLLCCGFRRTGKAMGQVYQWWWRICREVNVFPRFEYHMFHVLYPFVAYLLTLPRKLIEGGLLLEKEKQNRIKMATVHPKGISRILGKLQHCPWISVNFLLWCQKQRTEFSATSITGPSFNCSLYWVGWGHTVA